MAAQIETPLELRRLERQGLTDLERRTLVELQAGRSIEDVAAELGVRAGDVSAARGRGAEKIRESLERRSRLLVRDLALANGTPEGASPVDPIELLAHHLHGSIAAVTT